MKTMKYIIGLTSVVLLGSVAVSCVSDKEFLEEQPKALITIANA